MKHTVKIAIACVALASTLTLVTPSASAMCREGEICNSNMLATLAATETWMEVGEVLADDEEYVPGYEGPGPLLCLSPGETIGQGYSQATCLASIQRGFILVTDTRLAKIQKRKKRKKGQCLPFTGTAEYGDKGASSQGWFVDRGVGGCGTKYVNGSIWPVRCGPTSVVQGCIE